MDRRKLLISTLFIATMMMSLVIPAMAAKTKVYTITIVNVDGVPQTGLGLNYQLYNPDGSAKYGTASTDSEGKIYLSGGLDRYRYLQLSVGDWLVNGLRLKPKMTVVYNP